MEIKTINLDKFYFPEGEDSKKLDRVTMVSSVNF